MANTNKKILLVLATAALLIQASPALALELNYPTLNFLGAPQITPNASLLQYIYYFFVLLIVIAGIIGVISIAWSGLKLATSSALGNPESIGDARKAVIESAMGIILLLASFIILRTINPQLVSPVVTAGALKPGMYYMGINRTNPSAEQPFIFEETPQSESDTMNKVPAQFTTLYYACAPGGKDALVWIYNKVDFSVDLNRNGGRTVNTVTIPCLPGGPVLADSINPDGTLASGGSPANAILIDSTSGIRSFKWAYKDSGVYFYATNDCTGISTSVQKRSGLMPDYDNQTVQPQTRSAKIVNGVNTQERFGVMFYGDYLGCTKPITKVDLGEKCINLTTQTNSYENAIDISGASYTADVKPTQMYIFYVNPTPDPRSNVQLKSDYYVANVPSTAAGQIGDGQWWYSSDDTIDGLLRPNSAAPPSGIGRAYRTGAPQNECDDGNRPCIRNVITTGRFYVILYSTNPLDLDPNRSPKYISCEFIIDTRPLTVTGIYDDNKRIYGIDVIPRNTNNGLINVWFNNTP